MSSERIKLQDEISAQFEKGDVLTASDKKLQEYLMSLSSGHVPNDMVRHREIIRALTINNIQMKRHIDRLNTQNTITQCCVIVLTIAALIGTAAQVLYAKKADQRSVLEQHQTMGAPAPKIIEPQNETETKQRQADKAATLKNR